MTCQISDDFQMFQEMKARGINAVCVAWPAAVNRCQWQLPYTVYCKPPCKNSGTDSCWLPAACAKHLKPGFMRAGSGKPTGNEASRITVYPSSMNSRNSFWWFWWFKEKPTRWKFIVPGKRESLRANTKRVTRYCGRPWHCSRPWQKPCTTCCSDLRKSQGMGMSWTDLEHGLSCSIMLQQSGYNRSILGPCWIWW